MIHDSEVRMGFVLDEIGFLYGRQAIGKGFEKKAWMLYIQEPVVCTVLLPKRSPLPVIFLGNR